MPHDNPLEFEMMFGDSLGEDGDLRKYRTLSEVRTNIGFIDDPLYFCPESSVEDVTLVQQIEASDDFEKMFGMGAEVSDELMKAAKSSKPNVRFTARPRSISAQPVPRSRTTAYHQHLLDEEAQYKARGNKTS
jgi:hypothetical protein